MASLTSDRAADTSVSAVVADRYGDLAALAYMIMDDGFVTDRELAAGVARALWQVAGRRVGDTDDAGAVHAELRRRLLVLLVTGPRHQGRLARWARALTQPRLPGWLAADAALPWRADQDLRRLVTGRNVAGRAALALAAVDHLEADQVLQVLADAGITAPASSMTDLAPSAGRVRELLAGFDAALARTGPGRVTRRSRHRRVLAVAGVVVVAAAAVITAVAIPAAEPAGSTPLIVGADAWTRATAGAGLSDWPSQGDLTGDKPLLRAAGAALSAATQEPAGSFLVLYAGDLPGTGPLVVLGDPNGPVEGSVVSYRPGQPLRTLGDFHKDLDEPDLVPLPGGRLLVPPWHTGLRLAWLSGGSKPLSWQVLHVAGGIAAVPQLREKQNLSGCYGNLAAVQYQDDAFGRSLRSTGTDVIGRQYGQLAAWPAQVADRGSPKATPADIQDLADLTCGEQGSHELWLYAGAEAGYRVNVTDLGTGPLPGASGPVTAVSVDVQDGDLRTPDIASSPLDGSQVQFLNTTSGQPVAAGAHDAPGGSPDDISGAWWQPKAGGSWYLLAAGVRGLRAVSSAGVPLHRVSGSGSFAVFSAGTATPAKAGPVLLEAAANGGPVGATVLPPAAAGG